MLQAWRLWDEVTLFPYLLCWLWGWSVHAFTLKRWRKCRTSRFRGRGVRSITIHKFRNFQAILSYARLNFRCSSRMVDVDEDGDAGRSKGGDSTDADGVSLSHESHWIWSSAGDDKPSFALTFLFVVENPSFNFIFPFPNFSFCCWEPEFQLYFPFSELFFLLLRTRVSTLFSLFRMQVWGWRLSFRSKILKHSSHVTSRFERDFNNFFGGILQ